MMMMMMMVRCSAVGDLRVNDVFASVACLNFSYSSYYASGRPDWQAEA